MTANRYSRVRIASIPARMADGERNRYSAPLGESHRLAGADGCPAGPLVLRPDDEADRQRREQPDQCHDPQHRERVDVPANNQLGLLLRVRRTRGGNAT